MSAAEHDTPEAVEAMAALLHDFGDGDKQQSAAAMLLRLHARAVEAERKRDRICGEVIACLDADAPFVVRVHEGGGPEDIAMSLAVSMSKARAALATARADALREAYAAMDSLPDDARLHAERRLSQLISKEPTR